jgi:hypothetical protein
MHNSSLEAAMNDSWVTIDGNEATTGVAHRLSEVIVDCTEAGVWAFHCHILSHAEGEHGMYGMVTALIVKEPDSAEFEPSGSQTAVAAFANNPFICQLS